MHKITRIAFNSAGWQRPTGDARKFETIDTYNHKFGFGHEDWLFRAEWLIDGWRYAFIQGVNKSHEKLVKAGQPFDLTLYTIQPDKKRRFVAVISAVECLDHQQAQDAVSLFKELGWYGDMVKEIKAVGGEPAALGNAKWAKDILNVRFRQENVRLCVPDTYAMPDDPILRRWRYQLYDAEDKNPANDGANHIGRVGSTSLPQIQPVMRGATSAVVYTPEHARMQEKLMIDLSKEYPKAKALREQYFIDVSVQTEQELILFEIKSDLEPRTVIRQALGQILEYAYHPNRSHALPVQLVIVGRRPLTASDADYLKYLTTRFSLPLSYRVVEI